MQASLVAVCGLLLLQNIGCLIIACRLSCPVAYEILAPCPGIKTVTPALRVCSYPLDHQGSSIHLLAWAVSRCFATVNILENLGIKEGFSLERPLGCGL